MSLQALVEKMAAQATKQRQQERKMLQKIAVITSPAFAEQAAETLDSKKHPYSFEGYLTVLGRLESLIKGGVPNCQALEMVQTGETAETLLGIWQMIKTGRKE